MAALKATRAPAGPAGGGPFVRDFFQCHVGGHGPPPGRRPWRNSCQCPVWARSRPGSMARPFWRFWPGRRRRRYDSMTWTLRPWRMSDAGALAALLQDGRVRRMLRDGLPYPYTEADAGPFWRRRWHRTRKRCLPLPLPRRIFPWAVWACSGREISTAARRNWGIIWGRTTGVRESAPGRCGRRFNGSLPGQTCCESLRNPSQRTTPPCPGAGESGIPAGGGLAAERSQGRTSTGYEDVRPVPGRK